MLVEHRDLGLGGGLRGAYAQGPRVLAQVVGVLDHVEAEGLALQRSVVLSVLFVGLYSLRHGSLPSLSLLAGAVYWGGLNVVLLAAFVSRGWHGLTRARRGARTPRGALHETAP